MGKKCRGIALASLGPPPPVGPASSPMGIMETRGGPCTGSRHRPGRERRWSISVSGSVSVWSSVPPDPHCCPHPEGCFGGSVGECSMQGMRGGTGRYRGSTTTPNPIPSLTGAWEPRPTPNREGRRKGGIGGGRERRRRRTVDPPTSMGQKRVRWCGGGEGDSTVSRPVGIVVVRTCGAFRAPRVTKPRTGGPGPLEGTTWNEGGRKGGRGRQGRAKSKRRSGASVVGGAANILGDRERSYGGPKREGRVIV